MPSYRQQLIDLKELITKGQTNAAIAAALSLQNSYPTQAEPMWVLAKLYQESNQLSELHAQLEYIHHAFPEDVQALVQLANLSYRHRKHSLALSYIEQAETITPNDITLLNHKSSILNGLCRYNDAIDALERALLLASEDYTAWGNLGALNQSLGLFARAEACYLKATELSASKDDTAYNNLTLLNHYIPNSSPQKIFNLLTRWQQKYAHNIQPLPLGEQELTANKKMRIGMLSDGFRTHPVGQMITQILELLPAQEIELYAYSTTLKSDPVTVRIKKCVAQWQTVDHLNDGQLAEQLLNDKLDILFDLSGHMAGSRLRVMAAKPAPILVKWVGGLVNTTGLSTMDYLLSDNIETPAGVDDWYTEKLIRMPNDYVCYEAPAYSHDVFSPPATHNDYITLGCFNNTQKINDVVLEQWALIMHQLPKSKLFLKSYQFNSSTLVENVTNTMAGFGITAERLILEGPSSHSDLLKAYNKVDIALDPWPYSGGLTTCEAMFMGVPVVTYPGPTFAGRHSATHLTNVGLGQLVANSWEEYQALVLNLANDLDNLSNIRKHLRGALLESPLCDAQSFARHFANAMRAIWQRHCEGKAPAALTLNAEGECYFAGDTTPLTLQLPSSFEKPTLSNNEEFNFKFTGHIIAVEHGTSLAGRPYFRDFLRKGGANYICLDPGSAVRNVQQLQQTGLFQHFPLTVLGDGSELELALAIEAERSTTLPFTNEEDKPALVSATTVTSHRLDGIDGLEYIDWLILDAQHDNLAILENGQQKLSSALLLEVNTCEHADYVDQLGLTAITKLAQQQGLTLLTVNPAAESSQAIFIPNKQTLAKLGNNQLMKLAFLLDAVYSEQDTVALLLKQTDKSLASRYLTSKKKQDAPASLAEQSSFSLPNAPAMTNAEQQLFLHYLKQANRYFEFGSGGSTVWAVEQGLTVHGVESDPTWVNALQEKLGELCQVEVVDIGPTGDWGYPLTQQTDKFPAYSQAILKHKQPFDLILIDGRFRVACTMAAIQHIAKQNAYENSVIFIHDFWNRPHYHAVLEFLEVIEQVESAGVFRVKKDVPLEKVAENWLEYSVKAE